jgi:hypothetical protein
MPCQHFVSTFDPDLDLAVTPLGWSRPSADRFAHVMGRAWSRIESAEPDVDRVRLINKYRVCRHGLVTPRAATSARNRPNGRSHDEAFLPAAIAEVRHRPELSLPIPRW